MLCQAELSIAQRIPLPVPFEDMDGSGPEKLKFLALVEVGDVEILPELFALNEYAFSGSASPVLSLPPPKYK